MDTKNDCTSCGISSNIPSIVDMQNQINRYIALNLNACLQNFNSFTTKGFIITPGGEIQPDTKITQNQVVVSMNYVLNVRKSGRNTKMQGFYSVVPLNLNRMLTLAQGIVMTEVGLQFLEHSTMAALSPYMDIDGRLPPTAGTDYSFAPKFWIKTIVKNDIKDILSTYIPMLRVQGTKNAAKIKVSGAGQAFFDFAYIDLFGILNQSFPEYSVDFNYLGWDPYLQVNLGTNSNSEIIKPETTKNDVKFSAPVQINNYNFLYDISYPILIEIRDPAAFNTQGYNLIFAVEVNIRDNRDLGSWFAGAGTIGPWNPDNVQLTFKDSSKSSDNSVLSNSLKTVKNQAVGAGGTFDLSTSVPSTSSISLGQPNVTKSLFCDISQQLSGDINVSSYDAKTKEPIDGVSMVFSCGGAITCNFGTTQAFDINDPISGLSTIGFYSGKLPICSGGTLIAEKNGYSTKYYSLSTVNNESRDITLDLEPVRTKNVTVSRIDCISNTQKTQPPVDSGEFDYDTCSFDCDKVNQSESRGIFSKCGIVTKNGISADYTYKLHCTCTRSDVYTWTTQDCATNAAKSIEPYDTVMLNIQKIQESPLEEQFSQFLLFDGNSTPQQMQLVPGRYTISITYLDKKGITIPAKCQRICVEADKPNTCCDGGDLYVPEKDINMTPAPIGGMEFSGSSGNDLMWIVTPDALDSSNTVNFNFLRQDPPKCLDDMAELNKISSYSTTYKDELEPVWS